MCDQPDTLAAAVPSFAIEKAKTAKDVLDKKAPAAGTPAAAAPALQFFALHILDEKTGTCYRPGLRYTLRLILLVEKQVPATGQVSGTCTCPA